MQGMPACTQPNPTTEVTLWFRMNEKGEWMMNHLENGHCLNALPTPKVPSHKTAWGKGTWAKEYAWLSESVPPKVLRSVQNQRAREQLTGPLVR